MSAVLRVSDVMSGRVVTVDISASAFDAVSKIIEYNVGCVVVVSGPDVVGIITKGDILRKTTLLGLNPSTTSVEKVMSYKVATTGKDSTIEDASRLMSQKKVSKLPVLEDGKLVGIITSTDIINTEPMMVGYLHELIKARFVPHELG
jgi:CBS domain-containing protein